MNTQPKISRQLTLAALLLLLIPLFTCLIFYFTAKVTAEKEAKEELSHMQRMVQKYIAESNEKGNGAPGEKGAGGPGSKNNGGPGEKETEVPGGKDERESPNHRLLGKLNEASSLYTRAGLLIFSTDYSIVYPRQDTDEAFLAPIAADVAAALASGALSDADHFIGSDGTPYLISVSDPPDSSHPFAAVVCYIPERSVSPWVKNASMLVLLISLILSVISFVVLRKTSKRISAPLRSLCQEADRIGNGDLLPIEPGFRLYEPESLRQSMNRMVEKLQNASLTQKEFYQDSSHEMQTPLMIINGYAQGLQQGLFEDPAKPAEVILAESRRLSETIDEMLTLSCLETPLESPALEPVLLENIVSDYIDRNRFLADQRKLCLILDAEDSDLQVLASADLLMNVLNNVFRNALRHAKEKISFSIREKSSSLSLSIADDGSGIPEQDLPHVFDRYYKGSDGHYGLGLSIAFQSARLMGAELTAANRPEGGAVFTLRLPRA